MDFVIHGDPGTNRSPRDTEGQLKFWESQKLYVNFQLGRVSVPLTPALFKGQLYLYMLP